MLLPRVPPPLVSSPKVRKVSAVPRRILEAFRSRSEVSGRPRKPPESHLIRGLVSIHTGRGGGSRVNGDHGCGPSVGSPVAAVKVALPAGRSTTSPKAAAPEELFSRTWTPSNSDSFRPLKSNKKLPELWSKILASRDLLSRLIKHHG